MKRLLFLLLGFFLVVKPAFAATYPSPTGNISDFSGTLTQQQIATIDSSLQNYRDATGNQIAVAIIKDLGGDTVENYAVNMFAQWKIGQKDKNNGVLLLISMAEHKIKIEVGYGLEPLLTDAKSGDIIRNSIAPKFKINDYYGGILDGVTSIENVISGNEISSPKTSTNNIKAGAAIIGILGWFIIPIIIYLGAFLGRSKAIWPGGLIGVVIGILIAGLLGAVTVGLIGLFLDWILSKNYEKLKTIGKSTGFWSSGGGFWTGGSSSGGGFSGFSGGSSGGGGASGSW